MEIIHIKIQIDKILWRSSISLNTLLPKRWRPMLMKSF